MASTAQNDRAGAARAVPLVSDDDIESARHNIELAFQIMGLCTSSGYVCPACGTTKKGKVVLRPAKGYWNCYRGSCGEWGGTIKLLTEYGNYTFPDAVNVLLGRPTTKAAPKRAELKTPPPSVVHDFTAQVDIEVYDWVVAQSDLGLAQWYYGRWHISPDAVAELGAGVIRDVPAFHREATAKFGIDRLVACGLVKPASATPNNKDFFLLNRDYCVIEPHRRPDGHVVGMQFRPNPRQERKIAAHKAYAKARDAAEAAGTEYTGTKVAYAPKFLSLRGAGPASLVGCNLPRVARLEPDTKVFIVEGFKDAMSALTMGAEAYAIPGVGVMPSAEVCEILKRLRPVICMDGDAGGSTGTENLGAHFDSHDVTYTVKEMPEGMDVTDRLVQRNAEDGHDCKVCAAWRESHPKAS